MSQTRTWIIVQLISPHSALLPIHPLPRWLLVLPAFWNVCVPGSYASVGLEEHASGSTPMKGVAAFLGGYAQPPYRLQVEGIIVSVSCQRRHEYECVRLSRDGG